MMKMITIINTILSATKGARLQGRLAPALALSLCAHCAVGLSLPEGLERLDVGRMVLPVAPQQLDRFVTVQLPVVGEPSAEAQAEPAPAPKKVKAKKPKRKLKSRRRAQRSKRRPVKRVTRRVQKPTPKRPPAVQPTSTPKAVASAEASSPSSPSREVAQTSAQTSAQDSVAHNSTAQDSTTQAGSGETTVRKALSREALIGLQRGYLSTLNQLMRRERSYPRSARRQGLEGVVLVELIVDAKGRVRSVKVARSSGYSALDEAALADVRKMQHLPRPPKALKRRALKLRIPFEYRLQS